MDSTFKKLREYLYQPDKTFVVPNYQRGYKWSVKESTTEPSLVEKLCDSLIEVYTKKTEYFLQGITVSEKDRRIVLIDGQQRTTTLYLLLWCFGVKRIEDITLEYDVREHSKQFIHQFKDPVFQPGTPQLDDTYQDIHYFKVAVEQIRERTKGIIDKFADYILDHVKILYIDIEHEKAVKTFTMMNGSKATMLPVELIKAEMLRLVSLPDSEEKKVSTSVDENLVELREIIARDWETNAFRSRYAREWDKWLYWWNRADVQSYFGILEPMKRKPMGLLLEYHFRRETTSENNKQQKFTFQMFKELLLQGKDKNTDTVKDNKDASKLQFKKLRDLQKSFEDIYNAPKIYNHLKLALICATDDDDKFNIIQYFIDNKKKDSASLGMYSNWRLVGATHKQSIQSETPENKGNTKKDRAQKVLEQLSASLVYGFFNELALKQLLRLNVEEDNRLNGKNGRKFDFDIYDNNSLEHVHPKSMAYHKDGDLVRNGNEVVLENIDLTSKEWLNRDAFEGNGSEHCIGNLVLLDKNENSKFKDKPFEVKKSIYFNVKEVFKSRNLLHSISVFSRSEWDLEAIKKNREAFIEQFIKDYGLQKGVSNV